MPVMADMWSRIGIATDAVVIPEQLADDPAVRAEFRSFRFMFNPVDINRYRGTETPLPENRCRGNNYSRYRNPELDEVIDGHMTSNLVVMPLFHDSEPVMISNRVANATGRRGNALQTWNAHLWDVK